MAYGWVLEFSPADYSKLIWAALRYGTFGYLSLQMGL